MGKVRILVGDITKLDVDAIVNAANNRLLGGGGVDGAIHRAAGPQLLEACRALAGCATGQAKLTPGFRLPAKYVIHAVGPVWHGGDRGEADLLRACYERSLTLAREHQVQRIAFPGISTGVYAYPKEQAASIALEVMHGFAAEFMEIIACCFSRLDAEIYRSLCAECEADL